MRVLLSQLNKVYVGTKSLSNECNPFFLHSLYGVVQLDPTDSDIGRLKAEAKQKYPRMHHGNENLRLDKTWTGEVGEMLVAEVLDKFEIKANRSQGLTSTGYDNGDLHVDTGRGRKIINISSRKLSKSDSIDNFYTNLDQYVALIPSDQINQYVNKSHYAVFVYLKPYEGSEKGVIYLKYDFVIAGWLKNTDIQVFAEKESFFLPKGAIFRGLYENMQNGVPMYTKNLAINVKLLRPLETLFSELKG